jgi:hypothetical protein
LKNELKPEHTGRYVAIEPESDRYFLADTGTDALREAHRSLPQSLFYLARVGYPSAAILDLRTELLTQRRLLKDSTHDLRARLSTNH